jgi:hypothetical protein
MPASVMRLMEVLLEVCLAQGQSSAGSPRGRGAPGAGDRRQDRAGQSSRQRPHIAGRPAPRVRDRLVYQRYGVTVRATASQVAR